MLRFDMKMKISIKMLLLLALITPGFSDELPVEIVNGKVRISFSSDEAKQIYVAGDFNGWLNNDNGKIVSADPQYLLKGPDENGIFTTDCTIKPGTYGYKFVVDGTWYPSGDNLSLKLLTDRDGGLKIKDSRDKANSKYSSKIFFGGKFIFQMPGVYNSADKAWWVERASNSINLDFFVTAAETARGFLRLKTGLLPGIDSSSMRYFLNMSKAHMDLDISRLNLYAFYNERALSFDDPLRLFSEEIFLRQEEVELSGEVNKARRFGLGAQGVVLNGSFGFFDIVGFYANDNAFSETDSIGLRLKKDFSRFGLGLNIKSKKGLPGYSHTDQYSQFPDPESQGGPDDRHPGNTWYRQPGMNDLFYSGNLVFNLLPFADFYAEFGSGRKELSARYSNYDTAAATGVFHDGAAGLNPDTKFKIYKTWPLYDYSISTLGLVLKPMKDFTAELGVINDSYALSKILGSGSPSDLKIVSRLKYKTGKTDIGVEILSASISNKALITPSDSPSAITFWQPGTLLNSDDNFSVKPVINFNLSGDLKGKLAARLISSYVKDLTGKSYAVNTSEIYFGAGWNFYGNMEVLGDCRVFSMKEEIYKTSVDGVSSFLGIRFNISKNATILVGYGLNPSPVESEDEADERNIFLSSVYNARLAAYGGSGEQNIIKALSDAEKELAKDQRITVRAEMKF